MTKEDTIRTLLLPDRQQPKQSQGEGSAPSNIALCKYWGKRNSILNLPVSDSLSISLGPYGARTTISLIENAHDLVFLNNKEISEGSFYQRIVQFLNLFRFDNKWAYRVDTYSEVPIAAGLASSACGFAALVLALNDLFQWQLEPHQLSILARLGSGSACRSLWQGFVQWHQGCREDGLDSFGVPIDIQWPELCIGLMLIDKSEKPIGSREAMERSVQTSPFFQYWPKLVTQAVSEIKLALASKDFEQLGQIAETNALAMHALMMTSKPPVCYHQTETLMAMKKIWRLRQEGLLVFFTQDAGPNLKLLYLKENAPIIEEHFSQLIRVEPFIGARK